MNFPLSMYSLEQGARSELLKRKDKCHLTWQVELSMHVHPHCWAMGAGSLRDRVMTKCQESQLVCILHKRQAALPYVRRHMHGHTRKLEEADCPDSHKAAHSFQNGN